ncbi:cysteine proteinase inhibitor 12-like [Phalaenopsis equestris]|uniref:cysteine proteinase inhibitor 12-like n=1 Tax=Phalaenopsis equestris TaxID=78828 RepID=UPI0009E4E345|nr:cysteine proteinase inhibitor 12-like [Phalaenopsis equestris]
MASFDNRSVLLLLLLLCFLSSFALALGFHQGAADEDQVIAMATLGGVRESKNNANSVEIDEIGRFAVDEHNKKENATLEFARVVKAKEQVVSGTLHHLTLEAIDAGSKKLYEAKVWAKAWLNHKELQEFKHVGDGESSGFTSADLGAKRDGHEPGWRSVPNHDPVVRDAANHAVKTINERSNSLAAYELLEIQHAKAEVIEDFAKFDLLLKLGRGGGREDKFKVEVHKNVEGTFSLNNMHQEH